MHKIYYLLREANKQNKVTGAKHKKNKKENTNIKRRRGRPMKEEKMKELIRMEMEAGEENLMDFWNKKKHKRL